jgi:hypothetical protein
MARVLAVTTSMGTPWESYSQALLARHVPEWERLIIDGRRNWVSTGFIDRVVQADADYVVHVDEDCFVQSRTGLLAMIDAFERDKSLVAAGIPDGGHYYREHNPAALNLFFVVFRMDALRKAWEQKPQWSTARFRPEYGTEVMRQQPTLDESRIKWADAAEPYYGLFWTLMAAGGRFLYLGENLNRSRWSTQVLFEGQPIAEHLWYLRNWFSDEVMAGHDCANGERYRRFQAELLAQPGSGLRFRASVARMRLRSLLRRTLS